LDPDDPHLPYDNYGICERKKVKTRGKLGYPSENLTSQDGGQLPPDLDNLDRAWGIPKFGNPNMEKYL